MWVLTAFDLPTETKAQKTAYRRFREFLLNDGFVMLQFSVYARPCPTPESADTHAERIADKMPDEGQVRILLLTAMQYARMKVFFGQKDVEPEKMPDQLSFF
jgi:CRISPR-associated protein Cas2